VKELWATPFVRSRYPPAILAGLLLAAAFPNAVSLRIGIAGLGWIAPALILAASLGKRGGECFRIGYVAALAHYLASLYWLLLIPYRWHGIPFGPAAGWLALSGFSALFPAAWVWTVGLLVQSPKSKVGRRKSTVHSPRSTVHSPRGSESRARVRMPAPGLALWLAQASWLPSWVAFPTPGRGARFGRFTARRFGSPWR
jgi:hypothetical protein